MTGCVVIGKQYHPEVDYFPKTACPKVYNVLILQKFVNYSFYWIKE